MIDTKWQLLFLLLLKVADQKLLGDFCEFSMVEDDTETFSWLIVDYQWPSEKWSRVKKPSSPRCDSKWKLRVVSLWVLRKAEHGRLYRELYALVGAPLSS
jgi:hypothetical protein